jgi:hypothetical protein
MKYVYLEKLQQTSNINTLKVGYWIVGTLIRDVEVDKPMLIERFMRNGEEVPGVMTTSLVKSIVPQDDGSLFVHTENSIYCLSYLSQQEKDDLMVSGEN